MNPLVVDPFGAQHDWTCCVQSSGISGHILSQVVPQDRRSGDRLGLDAKIHKHRVTAKLRGLDLNKLHDKFRLNSLAESSDSYIVEPGGESFVPSPSVFRFVNLSDCPLVIQ